MSRVDPLVRGGSGGTCGTQGPRVSERGVYVEFVYLSIYSSAAIKEIKEGIET